MSKLAYTFVLLAVLAGIAQAQGPRLISVPPNVVDGLAQTIQNDSVARTQALPRQTIYMLRRNGFYPVVSAINNYNFFLHIKAEAGTGYKPLLVPSPTAGTTYAYNINFRQNGKLEGLTLEASQPTGGVRNRYINVYNGSSLWVKDCEVVHDRGGAFCLQSDSCSVYVEDCFVHSIGHPRSLQGNGRVVDVRNVATADSILVQNTTFFNLTDRIIRIQGTTTVNYVKFDHNTGFTTEGYHGGLELGRTRVATVTNNIFYNTIALGSHRNRVRGGLADEQEQPEDTLMWVVTLDTVYANSRINVRNNNIFWDQAYRDLWARNDSVLKAPGTITPTIMRAAVDSTRAYFTERLTFVAPPPSIISFIDSATRFPNATTLPENWWFAYQDSSTPTPINGAYGTTALSYTRGDGGFPVGDLNWYPARKAAWLLTDVNDNDPAIAETYSLHQNYPNPFNPSTSIPFTINRPGIVSITVYDILGREVATLLNEVMETGTHQVRWDPAGMSTGVYFYKMQAGSFVDMKKMILIK